MDEFMEKGRKNLLYGEFIRGEDGKYRYLKSERIRVYQMLYDRLKSKDESLFIYFCMERQDVWKSVTGITVTGNADLITLFDKRINYLYGGTILDLRIRSFLSQAERRGSARRWLRPFWTKAPA